MYDEQGTTFLSIRHKVVFIGNPTAGKTSLLNRIVHDTFKDSYDSTIGVDFFTKTLTFGENIFKLQLWDSAGQEKYRALIPSYIRGASLIYIVYDVTVQESFDSVKNWLGFVRQNMSRDKARLILIGNKIDLVNKIIPTEEGMELAKKENMLFFETSAKTGENIIEMFYLSFSHVDFFDDKSMPKEEIAKKLIEENCKSPNIQAFQNNLNDLRSDEVLINNKVNLEQNTNTNTDFIHTSKKENEKAETKHEVVNNIVLGNENNLKGKNSKSENAKKCGC